MGELLTLANAGSRRFYARPQMPVEANLLAFPVFLVSSTKGGRKGWFSYKRTVIHTPEDGEPRSVEQEWIVQGGHRYGLARAVDLDVCMAVLAVAQLRGGMPDDGRVYFSLYELKEILGWSRSGTAYELIRESIERTAAVSITSKQAFWSPRRGGYISRTFPLYTSSINRAWDHEGRTSERHHVKYDELVVEGYQDGYIGRLDPAFYQSLGQSTAKRLYMLADHHCVGGGDGKPGVWEIAPMDLMEQMPLARYDRPKKVEEVLEKGHEELVHAGYFKDVEIERGKRNTPLLFRYVQSQAFSRKRLGAEIERDPAGAIALAKLASEKVNRAVAIELVSEFGAAHCTKYAELLPFIPNVKRGQAPGMLVQAIRNRWPWEERVARLPKGRAVASVPGVPTPPVGEEDAGSYDLSGRDNSFGEDRDHVRGGEDARRSRSASSHPVADPAAAKLWEEVLSRSAENIDTPSWRVWFEGTVAVAVDDFALTVAVPNSFAEEYIRGRFKETLERHLRQLRGEGWAINIVIAGAGGGR